MRIIEPYAEILTPFKTIENKRQMALIELAARNCYKSEDRITLTSGQKLIENCLGRTPPHVSFTEHAKFTVRFVCDRGVSHELVRHRIASFSQESTRYVAYNKKKFGSEITVINPCFWDKGQPLHNRWIGAMQAAEEAYFDLMAGGAKAEEARSVLPQSTKTDVVMSADVVEWMHVFRLRCNNKAHPQMRQLMIPVYRKFREAMPTLFGKILEESDLTFAYTPGAVLEVDPYMAQLALIYGEDNATIQVLKQLAKLEWDISEDPENLVGNLGVLKQAAAILESSIKGE